MFSLNHLIRAGAEPLPGYRLVEKRGEGGYGQVWESEAPGGGRVALKFMATDRLASSGGTSKEIRSIQTIQKLFHSGLTRVYGVWSISGAIIVSMELADCSLMDQVRKAREAEGGGLPPEKVLGYMAQAAEVIDFLNARQHVIDGKRVGIQHADVKPSNFLLFGEKVKIADYGLSRPLAGPKSSNTPSGTLAYSAPEVFQHSLTEFTDQYALAVTYCVLRTGRIPFSYLPDRFDSPMLPKPDLDLLPEAERPPIARAMARVPTERWPTCTAMVQQLADRLGKPRYNPPPRKNPPGSGLSERKKQALLDRITAAVDR